MTPPLDSQIEAFDQARTPYPLSFNEFSEPRTVPPGWDFSELASPPKPSGNGHVPHPEKLDVSSGSEQGSAEPGPENGGTADTLLEWHQNRYLEPQAVPVYWDLCW